MIVNQRHLATNRQKALLLRLAVSFLELAAYLVFPVLEFLLQSRYLRGSGSFVSGIYKSTKYQMVAFGSIFRINE